jgi:hypothetical protein
VIPVPIVVLLAAAVAVVPRVAIVAGGVLFFLVWLALQRRVRQARQREQGNSPHQL